MPLFLLATWHRWLGSQELEFVAMAAMALVATITKNDIGKIKIKIKK
jgi:hypothetical protein